MANLTDADKVLRNDVGKSIVSKLDDIADAIVAQGGGAHSLGQLSDVDIDTTTLAEGQSIVYNETTQKFENGQVSTVGGLNDLDDVTLTNVTNKQELVYDGNADVFKNKTTRIELTQAEYDALANPLPDVDYYITDAPSMQGTSADLSYDGDTESTHDVIEGVKDDVGDLSELTTTVKSSLVGAVNAVNGKTKPTTVTPTFNSSQSNYSIPFNNTRVYKIGNIVYFTSTIQADTPYGSNPGQEVYSGLPKPYSNDSIFMGFCAWNVISNNMRVIVTSDGKLQCRGGNTGTAYDIAFSYVCQ